MDIWDYLIAAGIGLLVFFTPFRFGGVGVWSLGVAESVCFGLALVWVLKNCVSTHSRGGFSRLARSDFLQLALAATAFVGLLLFQLVPLPPAAIRLLSPHSYELYQKSLPGWPNRLVYDDPRYAKPSGPRKAPVIVLLPTIEEVRGGAAIPFAPAAGSAGKPGANAPERVNRATLDRFPASTSWRSLSVAPVLTRAGLLKCCAYAALFLVVVFYQAGSGDPAAERKFRRILVLIILASGAAVAMSGLSRQAFSYGAATSVGLVPDANRMSGPFVNPDHFANYLAMILPLAVAGALFRVPLERAERFSGFQLICAFVGLVIAVAIVLSLSRAGWIEIGLAVFTFAYLLPTRLPHPIGDTARGDAYTAGPSARERARSWFLPASAAVLAIAVAAMMLVGTGGRENAGARMAESISGGVGFWDRIDTWIDSAGIVRDYPLFGAGFDSWPTVFLHYQRPPWTEFFAGAAQNDYVEVAAECGIVGLMLLAWLGWKIGRGLYDGSVSIPSRHWPLFAALIPAIVVTGFHETLDFCMQIPANALLFVLLVGLALRLVRTHAGAPLSPKARPIAAIIVPATLVLTAVAGLLGVSYQHETVYPDDLPYPASLRDNQAEILSHPASPIPHLWLADRVHDSTRVWLTKDLAAAVWLDPTNPVARDSYAAALMREGNKKHALREIATAAFVAPNLGNHNYLSPRMMPWLSQEERDAVEEGLRRAASEGYPASIDSLAQLYMAEGRQLDAASEYEHAADREQDASRKYHDYLAAAETFATAGHSDKARRLLLEARNLAPDDPRVFRDLVVTTYGPDKNSAAAMKIIQTAMSSGLDATPLYLALAEAAEATGDRNGAEGALRAAVRLEPSFSNWMRLGELYLQSSEFPRARESFHQALEINPQSGRAYFDLAQAEEGAYQYPAARADYQRAIALAPGNAEFKTRGLDLLHKIAEDSESRR